MLTVDDANGDIAVGLYAYMVTESGKYTFAPAGDVFGEISYSGGGIVVIGQAAYVADARTPVYKIGADGTISTGDMSDLTAGDNLILILTPGTMNSSAIYVHT
jgi:hypothetical protein